MQADQIAWLNLKKHRGIIFKNGNKAVVLSDIKTNDKTFQYSIQPYLDSCQAVEVQLLNINQDTRSPWLAKSHNFIQFLDKKIMLLDGQRPAYTGKLKADYLYITGNPVNGLGQIAGINYSMLIIDGSNSDKFINLAQKQINSKGVHLKILKRNNSLITVSN